MQEFKLVLSSTKSYAELPMKFRVLFLGFTLFFSFPVFAQEDGDTDCDFIKKMDHPDARVLVEEFVRRDSQDELMGSDPWFNSAVLCPGHEPGYDSKHVIREYSIKAEGSGPKFSTYVISYDVLGDLDASGFRESQRIEKRQAYATQTEYGWRLSSPPWTYVSANTILKTSDLKPQDRDLLQKFMRPISLWERIKRFFK